MIFSLLKDEWVDSVNEKSRKIRSIAFGPLLKIITRLKVRAVHITNARLVLIVPFWFIFDTSKFWGAILFLFLLFLDTLDGALARYQKTSSDKGKFLDMVFDHLIYSAMLITLIGVKYVSASSVAYNIVIVSLAYMLAIVKKEESRAHFSDWIITPHARLSYLRTFGVAAFFLYAFIDINAIPLMLLIANIIATYLVVYYTIVLQKRWRL